MQIDIERFADRYIAVWQEPDPVVRKEGIAALWAADGVETTEENEYRGHEELFGRVTSAYESLVAGGGYVFASAGDVVGHHDTLAFTIHMRPARGGDVEWTGRMVLLLGEDGLIRHDYHDTIPG